MLEQPKQKIKYCLRCGRRLKTPENIERGMGKVCWEKSQETEHRKPLWEEYAESKT